MHIRSPLIIIAVLALLSLQGLTLAQEAKIPLSIDIAPEHPLFLFDGPTLVSDPNSDQANVVQAAWEALPKDFQPYAVLAISIPGSDAATRHLRFREVLLPLQAAKVPVAIRLTSNDPKDIYPLDLAEELLNEFTTIKGIDVRGLAFREYFDFGNLDPLGVPPWIAIEHILDAEDFSRAEQQLKEKLDERYME